MLDASVSDGVPATGAGNIEAPNDTDIYRFNGATGTGVFVDVVSSASELSLHDYRIDDPQLGAGTIEAPGAFDSYFFTANAGDKVFLDTLSYSGTNSLSYRLLDPTSMQLDAQQFNLGDMGVVVLDETGIYSLEVGDASSRLTGTYQLSINPWSP